MTINNFSIRGYVPSDEWLLKESVNDPYLGDIVLTKKQSDIQVFVVDGKSVGFAIPRKDSDGKYRTGPIYVTPVYRKKGIAGKFTKEYFKDKPGRAWIEENNVSSQKLFESVVFKRTARSTILENEKLWEYIKPPGNTPMLRHVTIANEAISVDVSRELGKMILAQVKVMQEEFGRSRTFRGSDSVGKLNDIINSTGMKFNLRVTDDTFLNAMLIVPSFEGHRGTGFTTSKPYTALIAGGLHEFIKMDLEKLEFSGKMLEEAPMSMYVTGACFDVTRATAEEATGLILHEMGHAVDVWATLGDYIYLNYMLTDGIDVLLGNKRNVHKLEILDHNWLEKNLEPAERDAFINHRTEDGCRRAIITAWKKAPRGYLFENNMASHKRDEQFADWFAARMGFARPLATLNLKMDKEGQVNAVRKSLVSINVSQLATMVILLPFTIIWMMFVGATTEFDYMARYDSPFDRANRLRTELIAQLKHIKDTSLHAGIMRDIEIIDDVLKQYNKDRTLMDFMADLSSPVRRREKDQLRHEQNLESLLNNDLFVAAKRFNS